MNATEIRHLMQEDHDYQHGHNAAYRGWPESEWDTQYPTSEADADRLFMQRMGWHAARQQMARDKLLDALGYGVMHA